MSLLPEAQPAFRVMGMRVDCTVGADGGIDVCLMCVGGLNQRPAGAPCSSSGQGDLVGVFWHVGRVGGDILHDF